MGKVKADRSVLVTGATGFIGRAVVDLARRRGLQVKVISRSAKNIPQSWSLDPGIETLIADLAVVDIETIANFYEGSCAVIHAAGSLSSDISKLEKDVEQATKNLLASFERVKLTKPRFVLLSSIAVYDYAALKSGDCVTAATPVEREPLARDPYCRSKLTQENLVRKASKKQGFSLVVLRPGAVFGQDRLWNSHLGARLGPVLLAFGHRGKVPLCSIDRCAQAAVLAATSMPDAPGNIITNNVLDDDLPNRPAFRRATAIAGLFVFWLPLPWQLVALAARLNRAKRRSPGILHRKEARARFLPLRFESAGTVERFNLPPSGNFATLFSEATQASEVARG